MGVLYHLWNRAFSVGAMSRRPKPYSSPSEPVIGILPLPESGGKDRKMKMNMMGQNVAGQGFMAGAVAINGGVGVMEMRRPQVNMDLLPSVDDVMNSVAAVAAEIAENAHITLRELKTKIDAVTEKKLPQYKQLMEQNPVAVAQTRVNGATITAYQNGYAVYEADGAHSVMAVDRCGDYRYDFNDGTYQVVPAEVFEEAEWSLRLIMEGERRMCWSAMALTGQILSWLTSWRKRTRKCSPMRNFAGCMRQ